MSRETEWGLVKVNEELNQQRHPEAQPDGRIVGGATSGVALPLPRQPELMQLGLQQRLVGQLRLVLGDQRRAGCG